ncbi:MULTISPECIES: peptide MFS transporter [Bacillus]|jgi:proton-dependent oligopeptide transporter, POT family|uniref:Peptide MFS transporter n=1 Tax=Bacillus pseudomycoides TaxID=64104 RepID=A0AAJ1YZH8_9BACI|nr:MULTISPECIES: peptide MFS transporter [Bacillus]EEM06922.1 Amino acid/peptide transporter [Bacillus pseudomycoides]EEM12699.1 Amino acid/peptide transporter [Bacillus pseudomycoides]MBJ8027026.1 peptide MFS transporter [Bacillus cereus group sp. N21]MCR8859292.1 peptide MFS transporter [Bacillus pseudomycoides]MDR4326357.1 peptide MFS transporter [Bacillus pseudomycoides]
MDAALKLKKAEEQQSPKKHPPGLYLLFLTEMWERFSYYGMRGLLVLYLTTTVVSGGLGFDKAFAVQLYGIFTALVYFTPIAGGWLTDHFITRRHAITLGGIIMAIGNFVLFSMNTKTGLFLGLGLLVIGNGFFKPNISTLLGELYGENDSRRDSAFTIFYMGINVGAFFAPLICGFLAEDFFKTSANGVMVMGYKYGFLAACIGMIVGQIFFNLLAPRYLGNAGTTVVGKKSQDKNAKVIEKKPLTKQEKNRTWAIVILTCFVVFFWAGFEQAGSSLTLYTNTFVDRTIFGWEVPTSWFQSVNPAFIVLLAPFVSMLWMKLSKTKNGDLKVPTKMALGMILLGIGYLVLTLAVLKTGSDEAHIATKANLLFIVFTYLFHTIGELFLSPIGLSMVSAIAPVKLASLLMGVWLAGSGMANYLAGALAAFTQSLGYLEVFASIGIIVIVLGLVLLMFSKKIAHMME